MKMIKRLFPLALVFVLMLSICCPAFATDGKESEPEPVEINSIEDFMTFAEGCTLDTYSREKTFVLKTDLSLAGTGFRPIQDFYGVFDGNGHSIKGLSINFEGSRQGLFRRIGEGGTVQNLNVSGTVLPRGSASISGGIVGENRGAVKNCTFSGKVEGTEKIGGICGSNLPSGSISSSSFSGRVIGQKEAGGICGNNSGIIVSCRNSGEICTVAIDVKPDEDFNIVNFDISQISGDDFVNISNLGGVCGSNTGTLSSCSNSGKIGYNYQGFNVGGIAGKSAGYINKCKNSAQVLGQQDVGGICGQLVPAIEMEVSADLFEQMEGQIGALNNAVNMATASFNSKVDADVDKAMEMAGYAQAIGEEALKIYDSNDWNLDNFDIDNPIINAPDMSRMNENLNALYSSSSEMTALLGETATTLSSGIQYIILQVEGVISALNSALSNVKERTEFSEDISVRDAYRLNTGAISDCTNTGSVSADSNSGGIAGVSAVELDFDIADKLNLSDYLLSDAKTTFFAVVRDCENSSSVFARDSFSGGIAGSMTLGAILNSTSSGNISSDQGDYVGGISGISKGSILNCHSRSTLSGNSYVGGICGYGCNLSDCLSYIVIDKANEYFGSIAGYTDGEVSCNIYVDNGIGALDGASYKNIAEPITYEEMCALDSAPSSFLPIQVRFVANGKTIKVVDVDFGGSIDDLPVVGDNEKGQYWKWDDFQKDNIFTGFTVRGKYYSPIPTLASGEEEPIYLVEGTFNEKQTLSVEPYTPNLASFGISEDDIVNSASLSVNDYDGSLTVHLKASDGGKLFITDTDGVPVSTPYKTDGSYIVFEMENGSSLVYVSGNDITSLPQYVYYIAAGVALCLVVVIVILLRKRHKKELSSDAQIDNSEL